MLRDLRVRTKRICTTVIAGLLFLALLLPQSALADPEDSISVFPDSGRPGDFIEATVNVTLDGDYRICWDDNKPENLVTTFSASAAELRTIKFYVPETKKDTYTVYLTREDYHVLAEADFEVFPSVRIDPTEGPVGTDVTITGRGFAANQDIRVRFNDEVVKTGASDAKGSWELSHTIPATPSDLYAFRVEFKDGTTWYDLLDRYFKVTPKITVSPGSGTVGQTVEVKGTGFAKDESGIKITFDGEVRAANIHADEKGSWSAVINIPPRKSDTYIIDASGTWTRARDVPDIEFIVGAGILVEPSSAYVGDTITVAGGGFRPGETGIRVTFAGTSVATGITADTDGGWEASFVLPASTHGDNTVSASGDITAAVTTTLIIKARIENISPDEGAPGDSVSLTGSGFHGNQKLTVTVGGNLVGGDLQTRANGDVVISFRVPKGVTAGKQTLKVTDEGGTTHSVDFTVKAKALPKPALVSPEKDSRLRSGVITFRWQGLPDEDGISYTYTLEISDTAGFATTVRRESGIDGLSYSLPGDEALARETYHWRVKAIDNYGNESPWSDSSSFTASPTPTWVWVTVGLVVLCALMVVAYRETKFKVIE